MNRFSLWRWPLLLAALTLGGLLTALLGNGTPSRILAWLALSVPLITALRCLTRK